MGSDIRYNSQQLFVGIVEGDAFHRQGAGGLVNMHDRIALDPMVCHGKPVIKGTRVLVATILGALAGGDTTEMILEDYPNITREDIAAALAFASELSRFEDIPYELEQA